MEQATVMVVNQPQRNLLVIPICSQLRSVLLMTKK